jgi:hypothetical protein
MRDIVATIQAEQDRVIRADLNGVLVVQGGPGTGKTAVALHRAAYLLYTYRQQLTTRGVLIVGPNPTFLHYISQVLPSLAETGVLLGTLGDLFPGVTARGVEPDVTAEIKGRLAMTTVLGNAIADRQRVPEDPIHLVLDQEELVLEPGTVAEARERVRRSGRLHNWPARSSTPRSCTRCRCSWPRRSAPTPTRTTRSAATTLPEIRRSWRRRTSPRSDASCTPIPRSRRRWTSCGPCSPRSGCSPTSSRPRTGSRSRQRS